MHGLMGVIIVVCRDLGVNKLYCFETWARQVLDFIASFVGEEPAFLICNSVGGKYSFDI